MSHPAQQTFCKYVKSRFPEYFENKRILDVGSLDINGNNRLLFADCEYTGLDLCSGRNVDVVCHVLDFNPDKQFDVVISTEAMEHDSKWNLSLAKMIYLLKPGGLLIVTCASGDRREHGTDRHNPQDSPKTNGYYKNLSISDVLSAVDFGSVVRGLEIGVSETDLYLWAVKK